MAGERYWLEDTDPPLTFKTSGGSSVLTLTSLASGAGRISARHDRGATAQPWLYKVKVETKWATATVVNESLRVHFIYSDGTDQHNGLGSTDAAVSDENDTIGSPFVNCVIYDTGLNSASGFFYPGNIFIPSRYFSVLVWNATADGLSATAGDHEISLIPYYDQAQ